MSEVTPTKAPYRQLDVSGTLDPDDDDCDGLPERIAHARIPHQVRGQDDVDEDEDEDEIRPSPGWTRSPGARPW